MLGFLLDVLIGLVLLGVFVFILHKAFPADSEIRQRIFGGRLLSLFRRKSHRAGDGVISRGGSGGRDNGDDESSPVRD